MLKTWAACPERFRLEQAGADREQSCALTFGTVIHACLEHLEQDGIDAALEKFRLWWDEPTLLGDDLKIDYYLNQRSWKKYNSLGEKILREWHSIWEWNTDVVLAREYTFDVPIGDGHILHGTIDRLVVRYGKLGPELVVSDFKTNANHNEPTYDDLHEDLQFTAYSYATSQPEFWTGFEDGEAMYERYKKYERRGEWIQLQGPKRKDAGTRTEQQYQRLIRAVNEMARSVEAQIYVPTISGASCKWCQFRAVCGLPPKEN